MMLGGSVRRIVAVLMGLTTMAVTTHAQDINDYPTSARVEYVFRLPESEWRDAAGDRAMLLFDRRCRFAPAL